MKVHYTRITKSDGMVYVRTPCGAMMTNSTKVKKKVTCKSCLKYLEKRHAS